MGWNPFSDISNAVNQVGSDLNSSFNDTVKSISNAIGSGVKAYGTYIGFNSSGKWDPGNTSQGIFGAIRSIDGAASAYDALQQGKSQFDTAQQQAHALIAQNQWNKQQSDVLASQTAGAAAATARSQGGFNYASATPLAMGPGGGATNPNKDFLGL